MLIRYNKNQLVRERLFISVISLLQFHLSLKTILSMKEVCQSFSVMVHLKVPIDSGCLMALSLRASS